ncbi:ABC transporter ATP-binding protein [Shimia sp. R9_3]|uniref:ABC transporter ATP-binding protein n=1 Tax=Shimia sp. R9_3 TaxID=2821113 RepID=UPI001ADBD228|nr:ATP-binding cassette domain-containing protein [Shimia sp. R9_3]
MSLSVKGLSYAYGAKKALDDVSFDVDSGTFCALLGPNGAGKTTLFSILTRLLTAQSGMIEIAGQDLSNKPLSALKQIGVVFQQPTLDLDLTVYRNLKYFAALQGISGSRAESKIMESLDKMSMVDRAGETVRKLNGGHRRRAEIARSLIHDPKVLLFDEPTVGLDAASRSAITKYAHALAEDGYTVLWATHLADEISPKDQLVILQEGAILANDKARNITGDSSLTETFLELTGAEA